MMLRKTIVAFLITTLVLSAFSGMALADPETASASPSSPTASPGDTASAAPTEDPLLIKVGDEGDNVILLQLRLRDLGYYNYKITGFFGDFTKEALSQFQQTNKITADGVAGSQTLNLLYSNDAKRMPIAPRAKPTARPAVGGSKVKYGALRDWFSYVNNRWPRGRTYKVVDFNTGKSYNMTRVGGQKHADVAPKTKKDTQIFKSTFGGSWSWDRRAVIVYVGGEAIAASVNGEPHGSTGVPGNGMNLASGKLQQVCIHFLNSRTHIRNMRDSAHQYQVRRAAGK